MKYTKNVIPSLLVVIALTLYSFTQVTSKSTSLKTMHRTVQQSKDIVTIAASNRDFATLVTALKAADLITTLSGKGPFTVFAPLNTAFNKLPKGTLQGLLKPESKNKLAAILTYHVIKGKFEAKDVLKGIKDNKGSFSLPTVQGEELIATLKNGKVILTDAKGKNATITLTDVNASNGVIHAIDAVAMPK